MMRATGAVFLSIMLTACGGGSSSEGKAESSPESQYLKPVSFASHFNNSRGETQTTDEFNKKQRERLAKVSSSKLIVEITRSDYEANTGYAVFRLNFSYSKNDLFQGPAYSIYSRNLRRNTGAVTSTTISSKKIVFTNESQEFNLYSSSNSLISCENKKDSEYNIYKTTSCIVSVLVDREKLREYDYHVMFDIGVDTLEGYKTSNTSSGSIYSITTTRKEYLPISKLKSISIMDRKSGKVFGSFVPY